MSTEATEKFQWILDDDVTLDETLTFNNVAVYPSVEETQSVVSKPREVVEEHSLAPMYPVPEPYVDTSEFPPIPAPPVNKAPRPITIVWGFVIMAIGVLAISLAAGAAVDLGLVMIWLPAIAGISLILAAILAAVKRNRLSANS